MAILATVFGALGRFAGKILTAALGWASSLLFGRVPRDRQILLVLITFGSIVWVVLVVGVIVPDVGAFLLAAVPLGDVVDETWIRLAMLVGALLVPLLIGVATLLIQRPEERGSGLDLVTGVLRGYPLAFVLAFVLVFLAAVGIVRKVRALFKRWSDAHVPVVVQPGGYEQMCADLEAALDDAGLEVTRGDAPAVLTMPARLLAAVAGGGVRALVPDRLVQLAGRDLEVQLYPSDVAIAGGEHLVTRARAALASRLTATTAYLTTAEESQRLEDRLRRLAEGRRIDAAARKELAAIDERLNAEEIPYEEWEVLYRVRLQVERDLLTERTPGAVPGEPAGTDAAAGGGARPSAPMPIELAFAVGSVGLLVLDVVLALRERNTR